MRYYEIFLPNGFTEDTLPSIGDRLSRLGSQAGTSFFIGTLDECEARLAGLKADPKPEAWDAFLLASGVLDAPYMGRKAVLEALEVITSVRRGDWVKA